MGRHCGYLALVAGVVTEADFVFVPEVLAFPWESKSWIFQWPPESNWPEMLCAKLGGERKTGQVDSPQELLIRVELFLFAAIEHHHCVRGCD